MAELDDLYRETILEHNRNPRHFGSLSPPCDHTQGFNALCGDKVDLYSRWDGDRLSALQFTGVGCALSQASASMLCEQLQGATDAQFTAMFAGLRQALLSEAKQDACSVAGHAANGDLPRGLAALAGARRFPSRVKCVLLPWETLAESLQTDRDGAPSVAGLDSAPLPGR